MADVAIKPISSIALALSGQSGSINIAKPREVDRRDSSASATGPTSKHRPNSLPTPPNSISPTLPPHKVKPADPTRVPHPPTSHLDSDIDLQDAVDHAKAQDQPPALSRDALSGLEASGPITPAMLAKHHLPEILLNHGPLAIRFVMGHLTQSVPGFARIPPAKARRIVVGALESKMGGGENGDVEFEKVGWGRWDARVKGQPPREGRNIESGAQQAGQLGLSPPASMPDSYALSHASALQIASSRRTRDLHSGGSWGQESIIDSREEDMDDVAENYADKMSLDGEEESSSEEQAPPMEDINDDTEEENWAAIGPEALRRQGAGARSASGGGYRIGTENYILPIRRSRRASSNHGAMAKSMPSAQRSPVLRAMHSSSINKHLQSAPLATNHGPRRPERLGVTLDRYLGTSCPAEERAAVEALLSLNGSV